MRDADVAHFGVDQAVEQAAAEHSSAADAGADGQVEECIDVLGGAPAMFTEGGGIHVGIEKDLRAGGLPDNGCQRVVAPSEFGSSGDGSCSEVDGAEAADADGGDVTRIISARTLGVA